MPNRSRDYCEDTYHFHAPWTPEERARFLMVRLNERMKNTTQKLDPETTLWLERVIIDTCEFAERGRDEPK